MAKAVLALSLGLVQAGIITVPLLTQTQFTILVLTAFITTLIAPLSLRLAVPPLCTDTDADFCELWRQVEE
ncbi:MAG: hypothetical protein JRI59_07110 [Deltaproteobacteria bacterium]|nr:hypothetical protein [Deltaproteobacteria bacterium]